MSNWYIAVNGQQEGPFDQNTVVQKLNAGQIDESTLVYGDGMTQWTAISEVPALRQAAAASPPPARAAQPAAANPVPTAASSGVNGSAVTPTHSHEVDYEIFGNEMQFVEIELDPQETVIAEAGAMMFMQDGIEMETKFGDGSEPDKGLLGKMFEGAKRKLTGESLFMTWFTNQGHGKKRVAFGAPYPGKIIPVDLAQIGGRLICQKDAFLAAAKGTKVGIALQKKIGTGLFGGEGFIMQSLDGDGMAFVHAGGTIVERELARGETLRVDTGCIVAYTNTVNYDITMVKGLKSMVFGGEGVFFATVTGPGKVWLQSLPFSRLADRIYAAAPQTGGRSQGEGSILGGLGDMLGGD
ncbi:TIGR00266 family protein [Acanthopleuribacter pedis]|uniref:TIGR00266 family protein n=1 Tax=Acanthopleuribacter pedis TaxID=442870 RepID=A0A8J7U849_9BACT|nr:TIGR00266 family protein [Acanthopleuribacter pedis]